MDERVMHHFQRLLKTHVRKKKAVQLRVFCHARGTNLRILDKSKPTPSTSSVQQIDKEGWGAEETRRQEKQQKETRNQEEEQEELRDHRQEELREEVRRQEELREEARKQEELREEARRQETEQRGAEEARRQQEEVRRQEELWEEALLQQKARRWEKARKWTKDKLKQNEASMGKGGNPQVRFRPYPDTEEHDEAREVYLQKPSSFPFNRNLQMAYARYTMRWQKLRTSSQESTISKRVWSFRDVLWPVHPTPIGLLGLSREQIIRFVLSGPEDFQTKIKKELLRWHPDRFHISVLPRVYEEDIPLVKEGSHIVITALTTLLEK